MIDSVVFRVHGVFKGHHSHLPKAILSSNVKTFYGIEYKVRDKDHYDIVAKMMTDYNSGKMRMNLKIKDVQLTSSHEKISIFFNPEMDYMEFNFSIPKQLFGTNIFQFVNSPHTQGFQWYKYKTIGQNAAVTFDNLHRFFAWFFNQLFNGATVYPELVEIMRLDLCFNQVFPTKQLALQYQNLLYSVRKKYHRRDGGYSQSFEEGNLFFNNNDYSFKIYKKGLEFMTKGDRKKLVKSNETRFQKDYLDRPPLYDIDKLQEFSDRILRYEVSIRKPKLTYIYKRNVFRSECPKWLDLSARFNQVRAKKASFDRLSPPSVESESTLTNDEFYEYKQALTRYSSKSRLFRLTSKEREFHDKFDKQLSCSTSFFLDISELDKPTLYESPSDALYPVRKAFFSPELLEECFKLFMSDIQQFQLKACPEKHIIYDKMDAYNDAIDKKNKLLKKQYGTMARVPKNQKKQKINSALKMFIDLIYMDNVDSNEPVNKRLFELIGKGTIKRSTAYRYKAILESDLGISLDAFREIPVSPSVEFDDYFIWLRDNPDLSRHFQNFKDVLSSRPKYKPFDASYDKLARFLF